MKRFMTFFILPCTLLLYGCNEPTDAPVKEKFHIQNDRLAASNARRKFDSIGMIADFITNSGGRLTTKQTLPIYLADTNLTGNLVNLGFTLIEDGRIEEAFSCLNKALVKDSSYAPVIYGHKAVAWSVLNHKDSVIHYFSKAIALDSTSAKYYYFRSIAYAEDSLYQNAIHDITKAITLQPSNRSLYVVRGQFKIAVDDYKGAVPDMEIIPASMKSNYMVYRNRALICLKLNGFEDCIRQCDISIKLNPNYGNVYGVRAAAKHNLGDPDGAYLDLKTAVGLGDKESIPYLKQYEEYFRTHQKI